MDREKIFNELRKYKPILEKSTVLLGLVFLVL